ncbi:HDOD domain-containing protein [Desulfuromonas acetoxidans]|uniref:HDOD domain-containing protein n=1 Tax=Desulfuromonas acetoxidans TaxID=891 RepID=UPI0029317501|nr:HDOD domain-containing protein [Desulfuromonas acetoxidans]
MSALNGSLSTTSLPEILRQCSVQQKTGTLNLTQAGVDKKLYFNKGQLIYITSNKPGERVGEYLIQRGDLTRSWAGFLLKDSKRNGVAFTRSLLQKNIFDKDKLQKALSDLANLALADVMNWTVGNYEFTNLLPKQALEGPIQISEADALTQILQSGRQEGGTASTDDILRDLARTIVADDFTLPLLATTASKLEKCWEDDEKSSDEILDLVHKDQVLSINLLRVVNASVAHPPKQCVTVKQAMELYPHERLIGIVLAQAANAHSPKQPDTVSLLLQHALSCACLAEQIAAQLGEDIEEAYTCGLLHNIGKILLLQILPENNIPESQLPKLVQDFHQNSGALLSRRWNLSPKLHDCIKNYSAPEKAKESQIHVEIVCLSHNLLQNEGDLDSYQKQCPTIDFDKLDMDSLHDSLELIDELATSTY